MNYIVYINSDDSLKRLMQIHRKLNQLLKYNLKQVDAGAQKRREETRHHITALEKVFEQGCPSISEITKLTRI